MNETPKKRLSWRLRVMMAERNISSATELQRLLEKSGYQVTSSQLTRVIKDRPERISTELLDHLLEVLNCGIGDLLRSDDASQGAASTESPAANFLVKATPKVKRVRREPFASTIDDDLTGPKVTAFPLPAARKK